MENKVIEKFRELFIPKNKKGDISMERYLGIIRGQEQFILEELDRQKGEILDKLPKEYEDKKLGRTDLTLNEMFERGYNSAIIQIKSLLTQPTSNN